MEYSYLSCDIIFDENGQGFLEYALIIGLVSVAAITMLTVFAPKVLDMYNSLNNKFDPTA